MYKLEDYEALWRRFFYLNTRQYKVQKDYYRLKQFIIPLDYFEHLKILPSDLTYPEKYEDEQQDHRKNTVNTRLFNFFVNYKYP